MLYRIVGKFGKFGESSAIRQTKTIKVVVTINNPLADLFICQTFYHQTLEKSKFSKYSPRQVFPPYGIVLLYAYGAHIYRNFWGV